MSSKIVRFLLSLKSVLFINYLILFKKFLIENLRSFFYFSVKVYQDNILDLVNEIKKDKNIEVILGYNLVSADEIKSLKKFFYKPRLFKIFKIYRYF